MKSVDVSPTKIRRRWTSGRLALLPVLSALALTPHAEAKLIGQGNGTSFAHASGIAKNPTRLAVEIASGGQTVEVSWGVSCTGRKFTFEFRDGSFIASSGVRRLPIPLRNPQKRVAARTTKRPGAEAPGRSQCEFQIVA